MLDDLVAAGGERIDFCAAGSVKSNMGGMWRESSLAAGEGIGTILASRPLIEHTVRRRALEKQLISLRSGERVAGLLGGNLTGVRLSTGEEITSELTRRWTMPAAAALGRGRSRHLRRRADAASAWVHCGLGLASAGTYTRSNSHDTHKKESASTAPTYLGALDGIYPVPHVVRGVSVSVSLRYTSSAVHRLRAQQ